MAILSPGPVQGAAWCNPRCDLCYDATRPGPTGRYGRAVCRHPRDDHFLYSRGRSSALYRTHHQDNFMVDACFQLKGTTVTTIVLELYQYHSDAFAQQLREKVNSAPRLFAGCPLYINLGSCSPALSGE